MIARCLAKDPSERCESTRDLYHELRQLQRHLPELSVAPTVDTRASTIAVPCAWTRDRRRGIHHRTLGSAAVWPMAPLPPPRVVPFATEFDVQAMPRWSRGNRIAYVAPVDGILQVFVKSLESSTPTQITRKGTGHESVLVGRRDHAFTHHRHLAEGGVAVDRRGRRAL